MYSLLEVLPTTSNRILNSLPREAYERLSLYFEPITLKTGQILYHADEPITHVYFPNRGTVSVICAFEDGGTVEAGMVGNEGMFGVNIFLGSISAPLEAVVQMSGDGVRIEADLLIREFQKGREFHDLLLRYTQAFIIQISQNAACNRVHNIDGRLARWLLMCQDRSYSRDLRLTQEFIATMLGARRAGITTAAGHLQEAGLISYHRGRITINDRMGLEAMSCVCYSIVKKEFDRLL